MARKIAEQRSILFDWGKGKFGKSEGVITNGQLVKFVVRNKKGSPGLVTIRDTEFLCYVYECLQEFMKDVEVNLTEGKG